MAQCDKIQSELEIKATPEQFYNFLTNQFYQLPNICSNFVHSVELLEGGYHVHGFTKLWKYTVDGEEETLKEMIEFDDENKKVSFIGLEGDAMKKYYKAFKLIYQINPKGEGCLLQITMEYEKLREDVPLPNKYMDLMTIAAKNMDQHLRKI